MIIQDTIACATCNGKGRVLASLDLDERSSETCPTCRGDVACSLGCDSPAGGPHGLIRAFVTGGYESTPGNGHGALDDGDTFTFSLCEFCLDWLFGRFVVPVETGSYVHSEPTPMPRRRVAPDEGRVPTRARPARRPSNEVTTSSVSRG